MKQGRGGSQSGCGSEQVAAVGSQDSLLLGPWEAALECLGGCLRHQEVSMFIHQFSSVGGWDFNFLAVGQVSSSCQKKPSALQRLPIGALGSGQVGTESKGI